MSYSLTNQGVAEQMTALYNLSSTALEAEAAAIESDFVQWVTDHFSLNNDQKTYLGNMSQSATKAMGREAAETFRVKGKVNFDYPSPPAQSTYRKFLDTDSKTKLVAGDDDDVTVTKELTITIIYR